MTWYDILTITLVVVLIIWNLADAVVMRGQRAFIARLELDNDQLLAALQPLHPSHPAYRTVDQVLMDMIDCKTCEGPRHANHFVYHPTHIKH